jgi:hypothetical protein
MGFWQRNIVEPGKLPLLLLFVAFIVTFLTTRTITRLIRAGKGPLRNLQVGSVHLHHSTPGILLLTISAIGSVTLPAHAPWRELAAIGIGIGASLVFDEFAMILHLDDVYWSSEGRQSVEAVALVAASLSLAIVGFVPFGVDNVGDAELGVRTSALMGAVLTLVAVSVCAMKGKFRLALLAIFVPVVAYVAGVRLARPGSRWDKRFYEERPEKRERAARRAASFDARWDPRWRELADMVAGSPDPNRPAP